MERTLPAFEVYWLVALLVIPAICTAVNISSCPTSCSCSSTSTILCTDINAQHWPDICSDIITFSLQNNVLPDLRIKGDLPKSNSILTSLDIDCAPSLRNLYVSFISLDKLPNVFQSVQVSETLSLTQNEILHLPEKTFSSLGSITSLNLSQNNISELDPKTFFGLYSLLSLDLSFNNIKSIPLVTFQGLTNLTYLNLGHNRIEHFTSWHLSSSSSLQVLIMNNNMLKSFYVGDNASDSVSLDNVQSLDISSNPLECSCILQKVLHKIFVQGGVLDKADNTLCNSPSVFVNKSVIHLNETYLQCSNPHSVMSFPSEKKSVLYRSTITLECHAEAFPSPHIMWITPWGEKFSTAPMSLIVHKGLADEDEINYFKEYEEVSIKMTTSIKVTERNNLVISHFRGSMAGNFSCVAFNEVGSKLKSFHLTIHCMVKSIYLTSLKYASYCASGCLIVGFLIGFLNIIIRKLRHKISFKVPLFTPAVSVRPITKGPPSIYSDLSPPLSPLLACASSEKSLSALDTTNEFSGEELSPDKRPHHILDSIGDAKEKLRDGVGRKYESMKRNVQSIKESTGAYVHNIMESGSSAATKVKAGMVIGMESVKSHVQSVKELCGTGNMGAQTVSVVSMETDIDTNQQKSLVRQVTLV